MDINQDEQYFLHRSLRSNLLIRFGIILGVITFIGVIAYFLIRLNNEITTAISNADLAKERTKQAEKNLVEAYNFQIQMLKRDSSEMERIISLAKQANRHKDIIDYAYQDSLLSYTKRMRDLKMQIDSLKIRPEL